jgi:hypothetical protein
MHPNIPAEIMLRHLAEQADRDRRLQLHHRAAARRNAMGGSSRHPRSAHS